MSLFVVIFLTFFVKRYLCFGFGDLSFVIMGEPIWSCDEWKVALSSLHWLILSFLYTFFVQWSILTTKLNSYPPPPHSIYNWSPQTILHLPKNVFSCAKRASKIIFPPREMLLSFSIGTFLTIYFGHYPPFKLGKALILYAIAYFACYHLGNLLILV